LSNAALTSHWPQIYAPTDARILVTPQLALHLLTDCLSALSCQLRLKLNVFLSSDTMSVLVLEGLAVVLILIFVLEGQVLVQVPEGLVLVSC
jgi:hypothetical protein